MDRVLIVIHLMVVIALVGVVLLQRSEGGGLGIGGGSGFMTARGAANALTRATAILAAAFFVTSLGLSLLARYGERPLDILDRVPAASSGQGVLDQLGGSTSGGSTSGDATAKPPAQNGDASAPAQTAPSSGGATPAPSNGGASTAPAAPAQPAQPAAPQVPNN